MKSAQQSAQKYVDRAGAATADYAAGARETTKDQAANAIAGAKNYEAGIQASIAAKRYEKGLSASGKAGWLKGITEKGQNRYGEGVASGAGKYATNSGKYDTARSTADNMPRGPKGSETNFQRAKAVGQALRKAKTGL